MWLICALLCDAVSCAAGFLQPLKRVGGPESPDKVLSASERREKFDMDDMVISFDTLVDLVISHWRQQLEVDLVSGVLLCCCGGKTGEGGGGGHLMWAGTGG